MIAWLMEEIHIRDKMKKWVAYVKSPRCLVPRILLLALCLIHEKTKYHTARSIAELFYWPDGFCADMVVIALFVVVATSCIFLDFKYLLKSEISD